MKSTFLSALLLLTVCASPAFARRRPSPAASPTATDVSAADRVIEPTTRVGAVNPNSTEDDIVRIYGADNVKRFADGKTLIVFPGGPDELDVEFHSPHQFPERVSVVGSSATWATANGLHVGLSVEDLEKINGGPFDVTGVNYQIPARVVSWKGGAFPPTMYVDLTPSDELDGETRRRLGSNRTFFESSNPALSTFFVRRIVLEW